MNIYRKTTTYLTALVVSAIMCIGAVAVAQEVQSLRGETAIDEASLTPELHQLSTTGRFSRNYRQQPPLIPHKTGGYEINKKVNQCLRCHDWPGNVEAKAPKISETHYTNREGIALDQVARSRWFCNQCHVPQVVSPPLVGNSFQPARLQH